jgi:hypothetical protein
VANANAPVNVCALSVGLVASASSSCSTTSVGVNQPGGLANVNAPITAQDNVIGLLNLAAAEFGLSSGQSSASTSQSGAINADAPISICSVNVGLVGSTSSACDTTGTSGPVTQKGAVDADVPVTVCDEIVEIDGNSSANCPQQPDPADQQGQVADVAAPVTACGAIVAVDGSASGMCMPDTGFPIVNDLPTTDGSQSAPVDGVIPVNACSVVVAVAGTASNSCEPTHVETGQTGSAPVSAPLTVCAVTAALDGNSNGTCVGASSSSNPIGTPGSPGSGASVPLVFCGVEGALDGSADASCPGPAGSASPPTTGTGTSPTPTSSSPAPTATSSSPAPAPVPTALVSTGATPLSAPTVATASSSDSSLASTGAPLLLEVLIGAGALLLGLAVSRLGRRRAKGRVLAE